MEDILKKKIETAALKHAHIKEHADLEEEAYFNSTAIKVYDTFKVGAMSPEAEAFHKQGMYTDLEKWIADSQPDLVHSRVTERQIGYSNALLDLTKFLEQCKKK